MRFFAYSWKHPIKLEKQRLEDDRSAITRKLHLLSISLPSRFTKIISRLSASFNDLYSETYPFVLTHGDLCEMNIMVNAKTGRLNGIIDWIDAKVQPFGLALWGVENALGYMDGDGWHYFEPHEKLVQLFWDTFEHEVGSGTITPDLRKRIRIAQQVGTALRHGFVWTEGSGPKPITEDDRDGLGYLDTFLDVGD
jgi:Ser/Thr protein kinase RdoA (MazF antagonist)